MGQIVDFFLMKYWLKIAKYYPSTSSYKLFLERIRYDKIYKRNVECYIHSFFLNTEQRELIFENTLMYS